MMARRYSVGAELNGRFITFVDRTHAELEREIRRIHQAIDHAERCLRQVRPERHPISRAAVYQLRAVPKGIPSDPEALADRVALLSVLLRDTNELLSRLSNSRHRWLEEARSVLEYGGAFVKKDLNEKKSPKVAGRQYPS